MKMVIGFSYAVCIYWLISGFSFCVCLFKWETRRGENLCGEALDLVLVSLHPEIPDKALMDMNHDAM